MEKPAETQSPIHDLLKRRWSPRTFGERLVEPDTLRSLFEAARWAPSSNNEQPWRFLVATKENKADWDRLFACLVEGNQKWARQAPVLMLSIAKLTFDDKSVNRHALHDTGMAVENLIIQATSMGLFVHQMAGFRRDQARKECQVPDGYEPVAMIALGYPGDPATLPDYLRERELKPRERNSISEFVFSGTWGIPSPVVNP
jgi:nitroreductase